ncbi:MAG: methyltransferase domain-containing protein [Alphaproteobacteria bacterium]|nr:methyltransferase domain-containing protein [Alphaproteobacteria bacterium]
MQSTSQKKLSAALHEFPGIKEGLDATKIRELRGDALKLSYSDDKAELLKDISIESVKKAWFTLAHLVLSPGAKVYDMGCDNGEMTFAMAVMRPDCDFTGLEKNKKSFQEAQARFTLPNLKFEEGNVLAPEVAAGSLDAVINSFLLHDIYSTFGYNELHVRQSLEAHFRCLKTDGLLFIRDYLMPNPGEYVLMQFLEQESKGQAIAELCETDLLELYAETARAKNDPVCRGFFLEQLPPRVPKTQLYRLPHKWAYEFILRKDGRDNWEEQLEEEYTFFTDRDYKRELRALAARVLYTAPHRDEAYISKYFEQSFRLYNEDGTSLGMPPTSYIILAQKTEKAESLLLQERRATKGQTPALDVRAMRDDTTGKIHDIATRNKSFTDVLPYRVSADGRLTVFIREGVPRPLANTIPRGSHNIDGRRWSGHMTEPLSFETEIFESIRTGGAQVLEDFFRKLAMRVAPGAIAEEGPAFYPDPSVIDERIDTSYVRLETDSTHAAQFTVQLEEGDETVTAKIREVGAQDLLDAIAAGLIPNSNLEVQLLALFEKLNIESITWGECPLQLEEIEAEATLTSKQVMEAASQEDKRFKNARGVAGDIKVIESIFVDAGQDEQGGTADYATKNISFILPESNITNIVAVLPLVKSHNDEVMAEIVQSFQPVPQRYRGNGMTLSVPSFPIPREIQTPDQLKKFVAAKFEVDPKYVARMGESYFTHIQMTPQRIYPYVINATRMAFKGQRHGTTSLTNTKDLWKLCYWDNHDSFIKVVSRAYKQFCNNSDLSVKWSLKQSISAPYKKTIANDSAFISDRRPK